MLTNVDHITLAVPDLAVALDFFTGLGFARLESSPGAVEVAPHGRGQVIVRLREDTTVDGFVIDRIAFNTGDRAADAAAPTKAGGQVSQSAEPRQQTTATPAGGTTVHTFIDPYGTRWELSTGQRD